MERQANKNPGPDPPHPPLRKGGIQGGFWDSRGWLLVLGGLAVWQGWLTLGLFGQTVAEAGPAALLNDEPILSGRHALHLYHGSLGATAFKDRQETSCYDPAFYAGYPKTAVFDSGSKPAELCIAVFGLTGYKWGVAGCAWLLPLVLAFAAKAAGLSRGASCLAALLSMAVCWSDFGRERWWAGDVDLLAATSLAALTLGLLIRYHTSPGFWSWLALAACTWGLCFCQVSVLAAALPAILLFYFCAGGQHRLGWHGGLLLSFALAIGGNWFWLRELITHWWLQAETQGGQVSNLSSWQALVELVLATPIFKDSLHQSFALTLLGGGMIGLIGMQWAKNGVAARTLGVAVLACLALAILGESWEPLIRLEPVRFLVPALVLATLPAAQAVVSGFDWLSRLAGSGLRGAALGCGLLLTAGFCLHDSLRTFAEHCLERRPLPIGLQPDMQATVDTLQQYTTAEARILWEEMPQTDVWTPLLPISTQRVYLGGLGETAQIEHASLRLARGRLAGRAIQDWTDQELADYCEGYNVGWIVCQSPEAVARFERWSGVDDTAALPGPARLFTVPRPPGYFRIGQGRVLRSDSRVLTLADLTPVDGQVVLRFHHHPGIVPSSDRVRVEKEPQLDDSIPFIRLRLPGPMSRLTLYWSQ